MQKPSLLTPDEMLANSITLSEAMKLVSRSRPAILLQIDNGTITARFANSGGKGKGSGFWLLDKRSVIARYKEIKGE